MMQLHESEAMALLVMARGVSWQQRERALHAAGSALAVAADPYAFERELTARGAAAVRESVRHAERSLDALREADISLLARGGEGYPERLALTARPPHLLFVRGRASLQDELPFAIVGTRNATAYGLAHTRRIARELAQRGVCVVSGLALGVDAAGHEGALDAGGRTIAVLGSAHDHFYPEANRGLMQRILHNGGSVITEYAPGTPPGRFTFLERNRIIAGLSLGVLVTEGAARSGALRTVNDALDEGREVFALPGSVESSMSVLPHTLIAEGARLVTCGADILDMLVVEPGAPKRAGRRAVRHAAPAAQQEPVKAARAIPKGLGVQEAAVCAALLAGEADFDALCAETGIDAGELGALLTMMEMDGLIDALPGLRYALS